MDVKAKIIYDSTPGDIINLFITFARVFDSQIQKYGRTRDAVEETLRICREGDILEEYLKEEEAATIMFTLLDEQKARKFWEQELRAEGRKEGRAEGENRLSELITRLKGLNRIDDVFKAVSDQDYRQKMYHELNI